MKVSDLLALNQAYKALSNGGHKFPFKVSLIIANNLANLVPVQQIDAGQLKELAEKHGIKGNSFSTESAEGVKVFTELNALRDQEAGEVDLKPIEAKDVENIEGLSPEALSFLIQFNLLTVL